MHDPNTFEAITKRKEKAEAECIAECMLGAFYKELTGKEIDKKKKEYKKMIKVLIKPTKLCEEKMKSLGVKI